MKTTKKTKNIIKWLKNKGVISKKFGYYVDEEYFCIRFPSEIEDLVMNQINGVIKGIPHLMSYSMWDDVTIHIHLNHPQLDPEKLYALLPAIEDAEKSLI
jgi:hypothetical protein